MKLILKFLATYRYDSIEEFLLSLAPSFKYNLQSFTITMSLIAALIDRVLGIGPALAIAMFVAVLIETITGITASKKRGIPFESFRFSRCILKVAIWYSLLYVTHAFEMDFAIKTGVFYIAVHLFFQLVFIAILSYFLLEYITSILENFGIITGKGKESLILTLKESWEKFISALKINRSNEESESDSK